MTNPIRLKLLTQRVLIEELRRALAQARARLTIRERSITKLRHHLRKKREESARRLVIIRRLRRTRTQSVVVSAPPAILAEPRTPVPEETPASVEEDDRIARVVRNDRGVRTYRRPFRIICP